MSSFQHNSLRNAASASKAYWYRHLVVMLALAPLAFLFSLTRSEPINVYILGLGFADVAVLALCLTMAIGPAARLKPALRPLISWRRQLGVGVAVASTLHVLAFAWRDLLALPGLVLEEEGGRVFLEADLTAALSWVGIVAFCYILMLAITSNDLSQRLLKSGWSRLHGQGYTLFPLAAIHTLLAVYLVAEASSSIFNPILWSSLTITIALQVANFIAGTRGQSPAPSE